MVYVVSYDLGQPNRDYAKLIEKIKAYGWAKPLESFWLVKTDETASQVRDNLKSVIDKDDKLVVIEARGDWATFNINSKVTDWMQENMK